MMRHRPTRLGALLTALLVAAPSVGLAQDDGFTFEMMEGEVKGENQAAYDDARALLDSERYAEALSAYEIILGDKKNKKFHEDSLYDTAKALYRMGLFHAALARYVEILEIGPSHKYYENSREWLFFIARRLDDKFLALELIATYSRQEDLPEKFRDEFNYQLARHYFNVALNEGAKGVKVEGTGEAEDEAALEFGEGDLEGGDEGGEDGEGGEAESENPLDFNFDEADAEKEMENLDKAPDDDFDFSDEDLGGGDDDGYVRKLAKRSKSKKRKRGKKKKEAAGNDDDGFQMGTAEVKDEATAHKNENPASAEEGLNRSLKHVNDISESFELRHRALYLKGLIHYARGEFEPAVDAFRQVVRITHPDTGTYKAPKLREMAFFSLGRIHYQFEQFRYAIFYYERIDRDSEAWLDSLFERSWAHFRLGEYERALGNLVTIQSPFFVDEYYPESHILKAITFYENCRYPEAEAFLDEFKAKYDGVISELDRLLSGDKTPEALYAELNELRAKVKSGEDDSARSLAITARLLRIALKDKRLSSYADAIDETDRELARLQSFPEPFGSSETAAKLVESVKARKAALITAVGSLLQAKLEQERQFLKDLAAKLIRIRFEIAKQEKSSLEASLRGESQTVDLSDYNFTTATDDERVYWPFVGEYWRDELGTYQYTLTKGCRPPAEDE